MLPLQQHPLACLSVTTCCVFKNRCFCFVVSLCVQRELAYLAAGVAGHALDDAASLIEALPNEDAAGRFVADAVNKALGATVVRIPPPAPVPIGAAGSSVQIQ
jgi:hypothetical protein